MTTRPQFTAQQSAAILARGVSIALSAGAGCGKTFVLTQRFLAGLEPGAAGQADLHQLVAITFTERAAREMRDRIRSACEERLKNCGPEDVDHWLGVLRGLDAARISTIHSFCTSLLRSQAVEAGLDPRFAVLEPALADTLLRHVARDTLHGLIESNDDDAINLVVQFGLERARELLRKLTSQRFQIDFSQFADLTGHELAEEWRRRWQTEFVPALITSFRESPLVQLVLERISDNPSSHETMKKRIASLSSLLGTGRSWTEPLQTLSQIREDARIQGGGGKKYWVSEEVEEQIKLTFERLRKAATKLGDLLTVSDDDLVAAAELACRALKLAEQTAKQYATAKQSQGVLDFDDLLLHARNLLRDNPHVCQRVAAGIRLLMVDEFQDTDPIQANVVRSLCGAALTRGKLFMVGDRKQSIYRFRRADPTVFTTMSDELPASGRLPLNVNFRSQPAILNFVNHLFAPAMDGYEPLIPFQNEQLSPTPAVEFLFAAVDAEETGTTATTAEDLTPADGDLRPNAAALRSREADWIARRIAALLNDPTPRIRTKDKYHPVGTRLRRTETGDIVILFRALSSVQAYEAALRRYGLDYYLVGGKAFFAQQEVFDLLNLCRYLDDSDDLIGLAGVLRSPFFNLSDDALQALAFHTSAAAPDVKEPATPSPFPTSPEIIPGSNAVKLASRQRSLFDLVDDASRETTEGNSATRISAGGDAEIPVANMPENTPAPASRATLSLHQTLYFEPPAYLTDDQKSRIRFAAEILADLRAIKDRVPLAELLTRAVERTGYDASLLSEFLGRRKLANLRKLIEIARQFDQGDFFTLKDFVTRLQTSVLEETDEEFATTQPESGDVIRLMSIHQSKGLEFPVVILADIDRKGPPRANDAVLHPELGPLIKLPEHFGKRGENLGLKMHTLTEEAADADETIRLFYVACTRAADYLILSSGLDDDKPSHSPWLELVESRFDIFTGLLKTDPLLGSSAAGTAGRETIPEVLVHHVPCEAKPAESPHARQVPPGELASRIIAAEPGELPHSAIVFARDPYDPAMLSVSQIAAKDAELGGVAATGVRRSERTTAPAIIDDLEVDPDLATTLGTLVHAVLERIDFQDPGSWPDLLKKAIEQAQDKSSREIASEAGAMLKRFMMSPIVNELAQARSIHREIEFRLPWRLTNPLPGNSYATMHYEALISGTIDVLIETDKGWHVLDYKTGEFPLQAPDEQLLCSYELQLGLYAHAVEQWSGAPPTELSLITFRPLVRRITLQWSPERWTQIRDRVERAIASLQR